MFFWDGFSGLLPRLRRYLLGSGQAGTAENLQSGASPADSRVVQRSVARQIRSQLVRAAGDPCRPGWRGGRPLTYSGGLRQGAG